MLKQVQHDRFGGYKKLDYIQKKDAGGKPPTSENILNAFRRN